MAHEEPDGQSIMLWPEEPPMSSPEDSFRPWLDSYLLKTDAPRGAVIVFPGGGYGGRAPHEGDPIAVAFNEAGLHAFVVQYRVAPHRHPAPLMDAARAVRIVRHRTAEWNVDTAHIAICGFSAGGHLSAALGVHSAECGPGVDDEIGRADCRPDALILAYPVISSEAFVHEGSIENLLGPDAPDGVRREMSLELHVSEATPPAFLWHTAEDGGVPVENSLLFAQALSKHHVPFELHVYPHGCHGLGLAPDLPHVATWLGLCCEWLRGMGW